MTLHELICFKEVATTLCFTEAAQNLFISQSSLSYAISSLEREIGASFFERHNGKRVTLTAAGEAFLPYANKIIKTFGESKNEIKNLSNPMSGIVRVAYGYINGTNILAPMFRSFYALNPDLGIEIQFSISNEYKTMASGMFNGDIDITFSTAPDIKNVDRVPFAKQELMVYVSKSNPLSSKKTIKPEDLKNENLIGNIEGGNLSLHIEKMLKKSGVMPNEMNYLDSWAAEVAYISMNLGVGILPRFPVDETSISIIPFDHPDRFRTIYMYSRPNLPPAAQYLLKFCTEYSKKQF